jgi:hypothetical protein
MELKQGQARGLEESLEILETERLVVRVVQVQVKHLWLML